MNRFFGVHQRMWARNVVTTHTYDTLSGELTQTSYSDGTPAVSFTYNRFGALATATDSAGTRTFTYGADLKLGSEALGSFYGSRTLTTTPATPRRRGGSAVIPSMATSRLRSGTPSTVWDV